MAATVNAAMMCGEQMTVRKGKRALGTLCGIWTAEARTIRCGVYTARYAAQHVYRNRSWFSQSLVSAQSRDLAAKATVGIDRLHEFLNTGPVPVSDSQINAARDTVQHFFTSSSFGTQVLTGARTVGEILAGLILMAVILFFFLKDGDKIRNFLPAGKRGTAHLAAERSGAVLGGYVRGTALVAGSNGLIVGVALTLMGVPLALPLAVFVFIGGFIPIIGSTAAGTLAVAVALFSNGPVSALTVLAVIVRVNQLEHHLLQPVLMGKVLSIHGLAFLLALAAGTFLAGVVGALLAVPITAVGWTVIKTVTDPEPDPAAAASDITAA